MKRILILATPRVGSNLLLDSLAQHPVAVTGGEILSADRFTRNTHEAIENISSGADWNLAKVFACDADDPNFTACVERCEVRVLLYRRDIGAQLQSWRRACETGKWVEEEEEPMQPQPLPENAAAIIARGHSLLYPLSTMRLEYEQMTNWWEQSIIRILSAADWPIVSLPMARQKLAR